MRFNVRAGFLLFAPPLLCGGITVSPFTFYFVFYILEYVISVRLVKIAAALNLRFINFFVYLIGF